MGDNPRIGFVAILISLFLFAPLAPAQENSPRAILQSDAYDFGTVKQGAKVRGTILLRNTGRGELIIKEMSLSIPALTVQVTRVIPAGGEAKVNLELDTTRLRGDVEGDVVLHTNDPQASRLQLRIQGRVRTLVEVLPHPAIFLTAFRREVEVKEGAVTIVNHDDSPLEIRGTQAESDRFTAHLRTIEEGQRYRLSVKLRPSAPVGKAQGKVTVSTNKGEVSISVFTFLKDKVYVNPTALDFGRIELSVLENKPKLLNLLTQTIFINKYQGQDFQIQIKSSLPFIAIEKIPREGPGAIVNIPQQGPTAIYELRVAPIKERLKPGKFEGTIHVQTNDKEFPELVIPVRGEVR